MNGHEPNQSGEAFTMHDEEATLPQICCPAEKLPVEIFNANRSDLQRVKYGIDDILSRNLHTSNHNQVGCSSRLGHDLDTDCSERLHVILATDVPR